VIEKEQPRHLGFNFGQNAAYANGLICGGQLGRILDNHRR
jgi:xanthine dehydrogenase accessory factor